MYNIAIGIIIGFLLICLIFIFCVALIKLYIQKIKKYNQILFEKEINHQKQINQTILETQENTLQNIAQELHDDAGQQLTYINFQLEHLKLDHQNIKEEINPVSQSLSQLSNTIRSLSHSLNNQILSQQNLIKAIETEANRINALQKIHISVESNLAAPVSFSITEKIVIYRIFQEVINNTLKHAKAKNIYIKLVSEDNFKMIISDDGKGFSVEEELQNTKTNGLQNLISRAKLINCTLQIQSEKTKGTTVELTK